MRVIALLVLELVVATTAPARAEGCGASANQSDLNRCADQDFRRADAALNAAYKSVIDRLVGAPAKRQLLTEAQRAWLGFRDAQCAFATSDSIDGSMHSMIVSGCRTGLTKTRTRTLEGYLACQDGDTECPLPSR